MSDEKQNPQAEGGAPMSEKHVFKSARRRGTAYWCECGKHRSSTCHYTASERKLVSVNKSLVVALKEVQWSDGGFCPQCAQGWVKGHRPKCVVGLALKDAGEAI
jgi:hypothetical protein